MSEAIDGLVKDWMEAQAAAASAYKTLEDAAIEAFRLKVGDVIKVRGKIGQVTRIKFSVSPYTKKVEMRPEVYKLKKDGTVASVGEIYVYRDDTFEVVSQGIVQ